MKHISNILAGRSSLERSPYGSSGQRTRPLGLVLALAIVFAAPLTVEAANRYVRAGAAGNGSGSDWTNAYTSLPATLTRGDIYYVADGNYPSYLFDDAQSGSQVITVKKATAGDHGTSTGWVSTYGDGQAVFTAPLKFRTGYYVFDGSTRAENDWFDRTAYGFMVSSPAGNYNQSIKVGGLDAGGGYDYGGSPAHGVQVRYTALLAQLMPTATVRSYQIDLESGTATTGFVAHRVLAENGNNSFFLRNSTGAIVEYSAAWKARSSPNNHGENVNLYYNTDNAIIRFNHFKDNFDPGYSPNAEGFSAGTAVIAIVNSANVQIYGNVFDNNCVTDATVGFATTSSGYTVPNIKFYNNTSRSRFGPNGFILPAGSTGTANNNLFLDDAPTWANLTHDYNATTAASVGSESNGQTNLSTAIFVNYVARDYRLTTATSAGLSLPTPYNVDPRGMTRGVDTLWDRGAYEYGSAAAPPSAPSNLRIVP